MASSQMAAQVTPMYRSMRRWPRMKIHVPVTVVVRKWDKTVFVQAWGKDLNEGGISVFAGTELRIGQVIEISFTPPYKGQPLAARTSVRNRRGYIYGLEFMTETREDAQQVETIRSVLRTMVG